MAETPPLSHHHAHLDPNFVPGTTTLVDLTGTIHAKHASGTQNHDVVLVPAPSADPDDPLNWSPARKRLATASQCIYTLTVGIASAAVYSVITPISDSTGLSVADLNDGTGYMFLAFGWGCLIFQPLALQYGKRPIYLFSLLATLCIMIWVPHATSNGQWIGSKLLQGFVGAPIESLCEISITDVYFQHERGTYMGLYAFMLSGSNFLAPILAGFINDGQGWEWVMYWCAIFCAGGLVWCFFFMEETNYDRVPLAMVEDESGTSTPREELTGTEKQGTPERTKEEREVGDIEKTPQAEPEKIAASQTRESTKPGEVIYKPKTYWQKLSLKDKKRPFHLFRMMTRPLIFLSFPVISYAGFSYGSNLIWFNVLNATTSLILGESPYNFASSMVGLSYVACLIGVGIGSFYSGYIGDRIVLLLARRNKGVVEPEQRLWLFAVSLLMIPSGLILWGVGAFHHIHWFGLIVAMGIIACTNSIGIQLSVSYCIDSYKDLSGDAMVTVIIIRNTMSFAVNYGVTPWVTDMGYQNAFIVAAFAGLAQCLTFLAVVRYGKGWRIRSRERYLKFVAEGENLGVH